ncbi:MAG: DCC1-like thiol-disulfide oxidoreductase family protein [Gaiellaceae bacterium]|jgi:predicted DCC family thiol-disulfide oxidoreductase YuxK
MRLADRAAVVAATVVYDGECGFCTALVEAASRRLHTPVKAVPWQRADLAALGVPQEDARLRLQWIGADGARLQGHRAVAAWLRSAGGGWRALAALLTAPGLDAAAAAGYRLVAANRRRIPGPWPRTCPVPPPDDGPRA